MSEWVREDSSTSGFTLNDGMELSGVTLNELWWRYLTLGGTATREVLSQRVNGVRPCDSDEHNLIAQALNEAFFDLGHTTFPVHYKAVDLPAHARELLRPRRPTVLSLEARRYAEAARRRSSAAALRAAALHDAAARLLEMSGKLQSARRADSRARAARRRGLLASID